MIRLIAAFLVIISTSVALANEQGRLFGRAVFAGDIPTTQTLRVSGDNYCEEVAKGNPPVIEEVVVNPNKTVKNVIVWVESGWPDNAKPALVARENAVLTQQDCRFVPHVLAVTTNQLIQLDNNDPTLHNVNALPKNNPRYNRTAFGKEGEPGILKFTRPEVGIKIKDDIHPWMTAWVAVFDHPAFAITDDQGRFEIPNIPQGEYTLKAWHEKFGEISTQALVNNQKEAEVLFTYTTTGDVSANQVFSADTVTTTPTQQ